jgi:hypothetical protein
MVRTLRAHQVTAKHHQKKTTRHKKSKGNIANKLMLKIVECFLINVIDVDFQL